MTGQERVRVVRGRERVAEARDRVADAAALGVELAQALLELGGHVVEGLAEGGELVAPAHGDALLEACPWRCAAAAAASSPSERTIVRPKV